MTRRQSLYLLALVTLLISMFYVRSRFLLVELSYKTLKAQKLRKDLERQRQDLTLELAILKSPSRIEKVASEKLGLERTSVVSTINLKVTDRR